MTYLTSQKIRMYSFPSFLVDVFPGGRICSLEYLLYVTMLGRFVCMEELRAPPAAGDGTKNPKEKEGGKFGEWWVNYVTTKWNNLLCCEIDMVS